MVATKNVLLVTSAAPSQTPFSTSEKRPPLGLGFLVSVLRNSGHSVRFIDNYLSPSNFLETDYLQKNNFDYVGIYANTICFRDTLRMIYRMEYLRRSNQWNGKIIVGGPHTTVAPETIPSCVDYIVLGEGEQAILDIVEGRANERTLNYPRIEDLDNLPMPAWDYFMDLPYSWTTDLLDETPVFTMNTSRGCPFACTFCSVGSIWGRKYSYFSAARIVSDIEFLINQYGAKGIYFREDNFTINRKRLEKFCNLIIEKHIDIKWACETRVNTINQENVALMYQAGARAFYFGVESGSQRILDLLQKDITVDEIRQAFSICHDNGIKTAASIIVATPTETEAERILTTNLINEIRPTHTWYNVFVGIPDSCLYRYSKGNHLFEFIDDRGLGYIKNHNNYVKKYYGNDWDAISPLKGLLPKISVIMAVFNDETYIQDAIDSVLRQSFCDFELIIIDDGSTDGTPEILKGFHDPRISIYRNEINIGLTKSLNKAISLAKGKYLARMDSDDLSLPQRLQVQFEFLEKHPDYAFVGSSFYFIDQVGQVDRLETLISEDESLRSNLQYGNQICHGSVMIRIDIIRALGGYDETFTYSQDFELWIRLLSKGNGHNLLEPLYCWRTHPQNISTQKSAEQARFADKAREKAKILLEARNVTKDDSKRITEYLQENWQTLESENRSRDMENDRVFASLVVEYLRNADALFKENKIGEAIAWVEKALAIAPNDSRILNYSGDLFLQQGNIHDGLAQYSKAIVAAPSEALGFLNSAAVYFFLGLKEIAREFAKKSLDLECTQTDCLRILARIAQDEGKYEEARYYYRRLIEILPDDEEACQYIDR